MSVFVYPSPSYLKLQKETYFLLICIQKCVFCTLFSGNIARRVAFHGA